jgi:hypothetical protein
MEAPLSDTGISDQVIQFLNDHISSVGQLEMLLLLHANPAQKWTAAQLARELRTEVPGTEPHLQSLLQSGLLNNDDAGAYYYAPATDTLHLAVIALAQAYVIRRVTIISLIFAKPSDNLRAFSDAFRLRKDPPK